MESQLLNWEKALQFIVGFFFIGLVNSQELPKNIDSLEVYYKKGGYNVKDQLVILKELSTEITDPNKKLLYSNELVDLAIKNDSSFLFSAYLQKGQAFRVKSDFTKALETFLKAAELKHQDPIEQEENAAILDLAIADVYSGMGNHENAFSYHRSSIAKMRKLGKDSLRLASSLLNFGDALMEAGQYDEAMSNFIESNLISNKNGYKVVTAYNIGNMGMIYAKQGRHRLARANLDEAIKILEGEKIYDAISTYLKIVSDIYLEQNKPVLAKIYAIRSLELSKKYQLKEEISSASLELSRIYEQLNQPKEALFHLNEYVVYKDSVTNIEAVQKMANLRTEFEVEKKQTELDLLEQ